ncbi:hypothetical protein GGI43DRAFT_281509 [Trichoderma evansii]
MLPIRRSCGSPNILQRNLSFLFFFFFLKRELGSRAIPQIQQQGAMRGPAFQEGQLAPCVLPVMWSAGRRGPGQERMAPGVRAVSCRTQWLMLELIKMGGSVGFTGTE